MSTKIYLLSIEDPEWDAAWSAFPDPDLYNAEYGECMQYMGTVVAPPRGYVHEFRHRAMPGANHREYWRILCTPGWQPRDGVMGQHLERLGA